MLHGAGNFGPQTIINFHKNKFEKSSPFQTLPIVKALVNIKTFTLPNDFVTVRIRKRLCANIMIFGYSKKN